MMGVYYLMFVEKGILYVFLIILILGISWDSEVEAFDLPPGMCLKLADIDAGSSTPKLVSKVLEWRKNNPIQGIQSSVHVFLFLFKSERALGKFGCLEQFR
jgi:phosphomevalonate kinase